MRLHWCRMTCSSARTATFPPGLPATPRACLLARLHAPAKPQVAGLAFMLLGLAISVGDPTVSWTCLLVFLFQLITAPISTHLAARAGYRTGHVGAEDLIVDEYRRDIIDSQRE